MANDDTLAAETTGLAALGRALRHRNYRLFFVGQSISLIGTWLTRVAMSWLVYRLKDSAWLLGFVTFSGQLPAFFLAPVAGVLVDWWNRHRVLLLTQIFSLVQSAALAVLTISGVITVWEIVVLSILQGFINGFDIPARQSFVIKMIEDPKDLSNAIALNSTMVNMARLIGPSLAGVLIAAVGEGGCFLIDAVSYVAVVASLLLMVMKPEPPSLKPLTSFLHSLHEGFLYVIRSPIIRALLGLMALVSLTGIPCMVLLPIVAKEELGGGPNTLGFLMAASGLGAVAGALYLASRQSVHGLHRVIPGSAALFGAALVVFSRSHTLWLSLAMMVVSGAGMMVQMAATNTMLQTVVEEDKRGRVMSFYAMAFVGMVPLGSLLAGSLADRFHTPTTILAGSLACTVGGVVALVVFQRFKEAGRPLG